MISNRKIEKFRSAFKNTFPFPNKKPVSKQTNYEPTNYKYNFTLDIIQKSNKMPPKPILSSSDKNLEDALIPMGQSNPDELYSKLYYDLLFFQSDYDSNYKSEPMSYKIADKIESMKSYLTNEDNIQNQFILGQAVYEIIFTILNDFIIKDHDNELKIDVSKISKKSSLMSELSKMIKIAILDKNTFYEFILKVIVYNLLILTTFYETYQTQDQLYKDANEFKVAFKNTFPDPFQNVELLNKAIICATKQTNVENKEMYKTMYENMYKSMNTPNNDIEYIFKYFKKKDKSNNTEIETTDQNIFNKYNKFECPLYAYILDTLDQYKMYIGNTNVYRRYNNNIMFDIKLLMNYLPPTLIYKDCISDIFFRVLYCLTGIVREISMLPSLKDKNDFLLPDQNEFLLTDKNEFVTNKKRKRLSIKPKEKKKKRSEYHSDPDETEYAPSSDDDDNFFENVLMM